MSRQTSFRHARSIAGAVLAGIGTLLLHRSLAEAIVRWRHLLVADGSEVIGGPLATILVVLQAYAPNHQRFLLDIIQQMWMSAWPLLLVMTGVVLSSSCSANSVDTVPKKLLDVSN